MSEYIATCDDETASWMGNDVNSMEPVVLCRDCISKWVVRPENNCIREEFVRCKDCAFFREKDWRCTSYQWHNYDESPEVEPDGFCAWGERRD